MSKPRGLGRGLGAFFPEMEEDLQQNPMEIPVAEILPNPYQPRQEFPVESLEELAESIRAHGVLQPLLVRKVGDKHQLIAGERRLRAAKMAGLLTVPVIIRDLNDRAAMEIALVENLQREDLNPLEEAEAYKKLLDEFQLTQEEIAKAVGKSRSAVTNTLRLLNLPAEIRNLLAEKKITPGHARALLGLESTQAQVAACEEILKRELSVRETEDLVRQLTKDDVSRETLTKPKEHKTKELGADPQLQVVIEELTRTLGTKVNIKTRGAEKGGRIEIEYYSQEELERIIEILVSTRPF
jgi:ParB family chromosome partitioning protein